MRILHTGDWHIGRKMNGLDLIEDQSYILEQLMSEIENSDIDLVVVAGDIFDRANPSRQALKLANETLYRINITLGKPLLVISGNHDSRERLNYGSEWFKATDFHINTALDQAHIPVTVGDTDFYLLPHIEVLEARNYFEDETIVSHQHVYDKIIEKITGQLDQGKINILVGHLYLSDSVASDSERPLSMGLSEAVSEETFSAFDYALFGHLHHPFAVDSEKSFYSGSLLKYSFSEHKQPKGCRIIDTDKEKVSFIPLEPRHDVVVYTGDYEAVVNENVSFKDNNAYFKFELSNMSYVTEPMSKIKMLYPNTLELKPLIEDRSRELQTVDMTTTSDEEIYRSFIETTLDRTVTAFDKTMFKSYFAGEHNETD